MKETLLACPFCGGDQLEDGGEQVTCSQCWATGPDPYNQNDCTARWNDRATSGAVVSSLLICRSAAQDMVRKNIQWHIDPKHILAICDALSLPQAAGKTETGE